LSRTYYQGDEIVETGTARVGESEMHKRFGKIPAGQKTGLKTKLN
jgi:hypothetical protein